MVVGGPWPEKLRTIAVRIAGVGDDPTQGEQLLHDIREILGPAAWITSNALVSALNGEQSTKTWMMTGKKLAGMLKPYGIEPRQERRGDRVERGYLTADFADAFARYVPLVPDVPAPSEPENEQEVETPRATTVFSESPAAAGTSGTSGTSWRRL